MNKENRTDNFELEDNNLENVSGGRAYRRPIIKPPKKTVYRCGNSDCGWYYPADENIINGQYTCPKCGCTEYTL